MIKLYDFNGTHHFVAAAAIARVSVACTSSQWHGIRSLVYLFDGKVIECNQTADEVRRLVEAEGVR